MSHNNKNILWKLFCIGTAMMISGPALCAGHPTPSPVSNKTAWGGFGINSIKRAESQVLLDGCVSQYCQGTSSGAILQAPVVVNMARKINDNGAYFCPTQVELEMSRIGAMGMPVGFRYYEPSSGASCRWICKDGHKGVNCAETDDGNNPGSTPMTSLKSASARVSNGNDVSDIIDVIDGGVINGTRYWVRVLAIFKYLEHGVHVGSLWIYGEGQRYISYIYRLDTEADGQTYVANNSSKDWILCDEGYKVNAAKTDCELITTDVVLDSWCPSWTDEQFNAHPTDFIYYATENGCRKFKCADTSKGFSSESSRVCEPCANRGGVDANGVCQSCPVGQTYKNGGCVSMRAFNKRTMQFGPNRAPVGKSSDACWTKTDFTEYKQCVFGN